MPSVSEYRVVCVSVFLIAPTCLFPQVVLIEPRVDHKARLLHIRVPMHRQEEPDVTVTVPLEYTPDQLACLELVEDITIARVKVNLRSQIEQGEWHHQSISLQIDGYAVSEEADEVLLLFFDKPVRLIRKGRTRRPSGPYDLAGPTAYPKEEASINMQDEWVSRSDCHGQFRILIHLQLSNPRFD